MTPNGIPNFQKEMSNGEGFGSPLGVGDTKMNKLFRK